MLATLLSLFFSGGNALPPPAPIPAEVILTPAPIPVKKTERVAPLLVDDQNMALYAIDVASGKVLLENNADRVQHIASITKLMTAMIILEHHDAEELVFIPQEATEVIGAKIDLLLNERVYVQTLLEAILIPSANDAAVALAVHHSGTEQNFVKAMNAKAKALGLASANFVNSTGLDIPEDYIDEETGLTKTRWVGNTMTAKDVLKMTRVALRDPFIRNAVMKQEFFGTSDDGQFSHEKPSTNKLLDSFLDVRGVKTGYTELAGQCLVTLGVQDGHQVLIVILGSSDRFTETKKALSWIFDAYVW